MKNGLQQQTQQLGQDVDRQLTKKEDEFFHAAAIGASVEVMDRLFAEIEELRVLADRLRQAGR